MKNWAIYQKGSETRIVKIGFSWWALIFNGWWAIYHRLWAIGIGGLLLITTLNRLPSTDDAVAIPMLIGIAVIFGLFGNSWVCAQLEKQGYTHTATIKAASPDGARRKMAPNQALQQDEATTSTPAKSPPLEDRPSAQSHHTESKDISACTGCSAPISDASNAAGRCLNCGKAYVELCAICHAPVSTSSKASKKCLECGASFYHYKPKLGPAP